MVKNILKVLKAGAWRKIKLIGTIRYIAKNLILGSGTTAPHAESPKISAFILTRNFTRDSEFQNLTRA
jgi:hypothetical protein